MLYQVLKALQMDKRAFDEKGNYEQMFKNVSIK